MLLLLGEYTCGGGCWCFLLWSLLLVLLEQQQQQQQYDKYTVIYYDSTSSWAVWLLSYNIQYKYHKSSQQIPQQSVLICSGYYYIATTSCWFITQVIKAVVQPDFTWLQGGYVMYYHSISISISIRYNYANIVYYNMIQYAIYNMVKISFYHFLLCECFFVYTI